jgi:hypothetical protein
MAAAFGVSRQRPTPVGKSECARIRGRRLLGKLPKGLAWQGLYCSMQSDCLAVALIVLGYNADHRIIGF